MPNTITILIVLIAMLGGVFFFRGGPPVSPESVAETAETNEQKEEMGRGPEGGAGEGSDEVRMYSALVLAGKMSPLLDFTKAAYGEADATGKLIVLYFYANWCPICKEETTNALYPAFNGLTGGEVIGFRVNYNDNETDDDERGLAREFGVAYQHTKVFVRNGARVLKSPEGWDKERYLREITNFTK